MTFSCALTAQKDNEVEDPKPEVEEAPQEVVDNPEQQ